MRIDDLTLVNFRCFANVPFEFDPHFNVVVGVNGAGKTSLLDGLSVALGSVFLGIRGYGMRTIQPPDVRVEVHGEESRIEFREEYPVGVWAKGEAFGTPVRWGRALRRKGGRTTTVDANGIRDLASQAADAVQSGEPVVLPIVAFYGVGRMGREMYDTKAFKQSLSKTERTRLEGYRASLDPRATPKMLVRWMRQQAQERFEEGDEPALLGVVRCAMADALGARNVDYRAKYSEIVAFFDDRPPQAFSRLSDGQRNVLGFVGDLARRMAQLNPHLGDRVLDETPGVVLIDELDMHLHPALQRSIVHALKAIFPAVQFVTTTHSPQVIGEVPPEEVIVLRDFQPEPVERALGLDSNEVLERIQGATVRTADADALVRAITDAVDTDDLDTAREKLAALIQVVGEGDSEYIRLSTMVDFLAGVA